MLKKICILGGYVLIYSQYAIATGMAIGLKNIILHNNTKEVAIINSPNFTASDQLIKLAPKSMCKINDILIFLPNLVPNDQNFYIVLNFNKDSNAIAIGKNTSLGLLNKAQNKFTLIANCKKSNYYITPIETQVANNDPTKLPYLVPKACPNNYEYVYIYGSFHLINNKNISYYNKNIPICKLISSN